MVNESYQLMKNYFIETSILKWGSINWRNGGSTILEACSGYSSFAEPGFQIAKYTWNHTWAGKSFRFHVFLFFFLVLCALFFLCVCVDYVFFFFFLHFICVSLSLSCRGLLSSGPSMSISCPSMHAKIKLVFFDLLHKVVTWPFSNFLQSYICHWQLNCSQERWVW